MVALTKTPIETISTNPSNHCQNGHYFSTYADMKRCIPVSKFVFELMFRNSLILQKKLV